MPVVARSFDSCAISPRFAAVSNASTSTPGHWTLADAGGNCVMFVTLDSVSPEEPRRARKPRVDAAAFAAFDRAVALASRPSLAVAPKKVGLTGLETFVWIEDPPRPVRADASAGGVTATAEAAVVEYRWDFGDGGRTVTSSPGRPLVVWGSRVRPGSIGHMYETKGRYDVRVEAVWSARWQVAGRPWRPLGYFTTTSSRSYPVREVVAALVRSRR